MMPLNLIKQLLQSPLELAKKREVEQMEDKTIRLIMTPVETNNIVKPATMSVIRERIRKFKNL